ncbi:hypothetical protein LEMLEM_LOCUS12236 [Lemmus lemmus]
MIQLTEMTQPWRMKHVSFQISFTETSGAGSLALVMLTLAQSRGGPPGHHSLTSRTGMKMWTRLSLCLLFGPVIGPEGIRKRKDYTVDLAESELASQRRYTASLPLKALPHL